MRELYAVCVRVCVCDMVMASYTLSACVCVCRSIHYGTLVGPNSNVCLADACSKLCTAFGLSASLSPLCLSLSLFLLKAKGDEILQLNLFQQISANKMMKNPTVYPLAKFFIFLLSTLRCIVYFIFFPVPVFRCLL